MIVTNNPSYHHHLIRDESPVLLPSVSSLLASIHTHHSHISSPATSPLYSSNSPKKPMLMASPLPSQMMNNVRENGSMMSPKVNIPSPLASTVTPRGSSPGHTEFPSAVSTPFIRPVSRSSSAVPPTPTLPSIRTAPPSTGYLLPQLSASPMQSRPKASSLHTSFSALPVQSPHHSRMQKASDYLSHRDVREGDLATAMILMGIQTKQDPTFPFRKKRQRSSPAQLNVLEEQFLINPMPSHMARVELALRLNMTPRRIQVWFQNKRAKVRRAVRNGEEVGVHLPESDPDEP